MMTGGEIGEATRVLDGLLSELSEMRNIAVGSMIDESGFRRSDLCPPHYHDMLHLGGDGTSKEWIAPDDKFCLARPVSIDDAKAALDAADYERFELMVKSDPTIRCSRVRMASRMDGFSFPLVAEDIICSGDATSMTRFESRWFGVQPSNEEVTRIRRLSEGDMRGSAIPSSWEVGTQASVGVGPGVKGGGKLITDGAAATLSRAVIFDNDYLQLRMGVAGGFTQRPYLDDDFRERAVQGAQLAFAPELRLYFGANVFTSSALAVGYVFSDPKNRGVTFDLGLGAGYQLSNRLSIIGRAAMLETGTDGVPVGGATLDATWRL